MKHRESHTRLHNIWLGMKNRCYNKNSDRFPFYGDRGITVTDEWKHDYMAFRDWALKNGYSDDLTIERVDVNKGYSPTNCKWIDRKGQARNRRSTVLFNGKTLPEWEEITGISYKTLWRRLHAGWDFDKAISTKTKK